MITKKQGKRTSKKPELVKNKLMFSSSLTVRNTLMSDEDHS